MFIHRETLCSNCAYKQLKNLKYILGYWVPKPAGPMPILITVWWQN